MKDKRGFTLIELIAVIVIIGLVALIAVPFFTGSLEDFRKNFYVNLSTTFLSGGKEFFADNSRYLPRRYLFAQKVTLGTLESEKYVKSFKDYKGNDCDLENSYVIVIKLADKKYEYVPCLKCPSDSYENINNKYCNPEWLDNGNINQELGHVDTIYIYRGTSREVLKEKTKATLNLVKYNGAGEEVARVSGVGEEGIGIVYPSNLDIVDTNVVGEYELEYTYQEKRTTGIVIVYENQAPDIEVTRNQRDKDKTQPIESISTVANNSLYDSSEYERTPDDVWAYQLVYDMSSKPLTVPGETIAEYQWYIHGRWETFCKPDSGLSCSKTVSEEMNETVKFRSIDSSGNLGIISREYVVRIDRTKPECTLKNFPDPDGQNNWHIADFDVEFANIKNPVKYVHDKIVTSGLVDTYTTVAVDGTILNADGILGRDRATQTEDDTSFTWYGYVEDKAGNWYLCNSPTRKKDKTPPTCTLKVTSGTALDSNHYDNNGVRIGFNTKDDTGGSRLVAYGVGLTATYNNSTSFLYKQAGSKSVNGYVKDGAGNVSTCSLAACRQEQKQSGSDATCTSKACCGDHSCNCRTVCSDPDGNYGGPMHCDGYSCNGKCYDTRKTVCSRCDNTCTSSCCGINWGSWNDSKTCSSGTYTNCRTTYKVGNNCSNLDSTTFTATFNPNNGNSNVTSFVEVSCETTTGSCNITLPAANTYNYDNHIFNGWSLNNCSATSGLGAGTSATLTGDVVYCATWTEDTVSFTASFSANGGTGTVADVSCTAGKAEAEPACDITLPANGFNRPGYDYSAWNADETYLHPGDILSLTGNITIPATWQIKTYSIVYTLNSGSLSSSNPTSYTVETNSFTLNNPSRAHYVFTGWTGTDLSAATKTVTIAKGSTGDRAYTANWTAAPKATITCNDKTYNGANQVIATCSGGTISGATKKNVGSYQVTCSGDNAHSNADAKTCSITCPSGQHSNGSGGCAPDCTNFDKSACGGWPGCTAANTCLTGTSPGASCKCFAYNNKCYINDGGDSNRFATFNDGHVWVSDNSDCDACYPNADNANCKASCICSETGRRSYLDRSVTWNDSSQICEGCGGYGTYRNDYRWDGYVSGVGGYTSYQDYCEFSLKKKNGC